MEVAGPRKKKTEDTTWRCGARGRWVCVYIDG
jgi:hypothetical protein